MGAHIGARPYFCRPCVKVSLLREPAFGCELVRISIATAQARFSQNSDNAGFVVA
jgi:hypothetical protein